MKVLLADDCRDFVDGFSLLLRHLGHDIYGAYGGNEALEADAWFESDVAILDIAMPGMDGFELARALRGKHPDLVLIAMTGWTTDSYRHQADKAGFDGYIVKPASVKDLIDLVYRIRTRRRISSQEAPLDLAVVA